jgi:hypothetical protein
VESCEFYKFGMQPTEFVCYIVGAYDILVADSHFEVSSDSISTSAVRIFNTLNTDLKTLFQIADPAVFTENLNGVAQKIRGLSGPNRVVLATKLKDAVNTGSYKLTASEAAAYQALGTVLTPVTVNLGSLVNALNGIYQAAGAAGASVAAVPATALVIGDSQAHTIVRNNRINGVLSLYGPSTGERLTTAEVNRIREGKMTGYFKDNTFTTTDAEIRLTGNRIARLAVGGEFWNNFKYALDNPGKGTALPPLFRLGTFTDNSFADVENYFPAGITMLTANHFALSMVSGMGGGGTTGVGPTAAIVIGKSASYTNNHGAYINGVPLAVVYGITNATMNPNVFKTVNQWLDLHECYF